MKTDSSGIKLQVRLLIAAGQDGLGRLVSEVIEERLGQKYDLRVTFAKHADELLKLVRNQVFDVIIVIADSISFSSETSSPSPEDLEEKVLQLIRYLKRRYETPVLALHGWGDPDFGEKIDAADFSLKYPRIFDELREAVQGFIEGTFDTKAAEKRQPVTDKRRGEKAPTAAIIPEEEGLRLMGNLKSLGKVFRALPNDPGGGGALPPDRPKTYDPNLFFDVFDRLHPMDGCTLDYCFHRFAGFGLPYIYTRRIDSAPIKDYKEFNERFPYRRNRIRHIEVEPSPSGYFQFAVFYNAACQSHLFRHCRWGLTQPVITENQLKRTLDFIAGETKRRELLKKYSLKPRLGVLMCEDLVKVIFIAFNPFRGLYFQHTYIRSNIIEYVDRIKIPDCASSFEF